MQTQVNLYPAEAMPGALATVHQAIFTAKQYVAADDTLKVGGFAFAGGTDGTATAKSETGALLGFVVRNQAYFNYDLTDAEGTLAVPEGATVQLAVKADVYIVAPAAATVGQKVLVTRATGAVSLGTAATDGVVDTGYVVKTAGAKDAVILISSWS